MERRRLGKTGLEVGVIGFGGLVAAGRPQAEVDALVGQALDAGVNYVDTAHSYGDCQEKLGAALGHKRAQVVLGAKLIYRDSQAAAAEVDHSLRRLRTDHIDIYHLHAVDTAEQWEQSSADRGALVALEQARDAGKIRFLGVTGHMPQVQAQALKSGRLDTVMATSNYVDQFIYGSEVMLHPLARALCAGVFVLKPTAHNTIADRELAYRYVLSQDVDCIIPPRQKEEFLWVLRDADRLSPLSPEELRTLCVSAPELDGLCRQCGACLPCPEGIDVPTVLRLAGWLQRFGQTKDLARQAYAGCQTKAEQCTQCGVCDQRCPYGLQVAAQLGRAHQDLIGDTG